VDRLRIVKSDSRRAIGVSQAELEFQAAILQGVSRTFALTIPVLPADLADVVANAYLLCRLADTIEDDLALEDCAKTAFHDRFVAVIRGDSDAEKFAQDLAPLLSEKTLAAERSLVENAARVIRLTHTFPEHDQQAIVRCLDTMCAGMPEFQRHRNPGGLVDLGALSSYCYVVAGVVGEMLTELFCEHCPELAPGKQELLLLAPSFGQGLQMTNILKDVWEDRHADTCWLPRSVFGGSFDLSRLDELYRTAEYRRGIEELIGIAHHHLRNAMRYTLIVPSSQAGIRRFCLWAVGFALLTLRKVQKYCDYRRGERVKISRRSVRAVVLAVDAAARSDRALTLLFDLAAAGLPLVAGGSGARPEQLRRRQPGASRA
jgi:farnesyl-diphosphate farnesyltransferase